MKSGCGMINITVPFASFPFLSAQLRAAIRRELSLMRWFIKENFFEKRDLEENCLERNCSKNVQLLYVGQPHLLGLNGSEHRPLFPIGSTLHSHAFHKYTFKCQESNVRACWGLALAFSYWINRSVGLPTFTLYVDRSFSWFVSLAGSPAGP